MRTAFRQVLKCYTSKLGQLQHEGMPDRHGITVLPVQLQGGEAHLVLSLQHLPPGQRRFAPLGVVSCSDICAGLLYKLGPSLQPHQRNFLEQYKVLHDFSYCPPCTTLHHAMHHAIQSQHGTNQAPAVAVFMTWGKLFVE